MKGDRDQAFVEMLVLDVSTRSANAATRSSLESLVTAPDVQVVAGPHFIGDYERSSTMDLLDVQGPTERATLHRLRMEPHHAEPGVTVLNLELTLQLPNPRGTLPNPTRTVPLALSAGEDLPALAHATWDEARQRSLLLVVRMRPVRGQEDLRAIFECKMRRYQETRRRPP